MSWRAHSHAAQMKVKSNRGINVLERNSCTGSITQIEFQTKTICIYYTLIYMKVYYIQTDFLRIYAATVIHKATQSLWDFLRLIYLRLQFVYLYYKQIHRQILLYCDSSNFSSMCSRETESRYKKKFHNKAR